MRFLSCVVCCALAAAVAAQNPPPAGWVALRGQVVLPANAPVPPRPPLNVNGPDAKACLKNGPILDESVIVSPKTRGIKNVVVWLRPNDMNLKAAFAPNEIHPADAKRKPATVVIDQPCCMFVDRVTCARVGDTVEVKNPAAFPHNFFWASENNGSLNETIPPGGTFRFKMPLVAEGGPIEYRCTIHPWMNGWVRVFDHPYYAVTDEDGRFEIKNAPVGNYRIVYWHEKVGVLGGKAGRPGAPVAIADNGKGAMEMKPTDFPVP